MAMPQQDFKNRGPIEYTSLASAVAFSPPIRWVQVATAGSGGLVVKDEAGTARTYTGLGTGDVLVGPFSELTSMTCTKIRVGDGDPPALTPVSSLLGSTAAGNGASLVGIADAGTFTAQTTVEAALQEIYQDLETTQGVIAFDLKAAILAAGTPMAAFADNASSNPGITLNNSKAVGIRWNNNASQTAVWTSCVLPLDLDVTAAMTFNVLASKSGATLADATKFTISAFAQTVGALEDAGSDLGGDSTAMTGNATAKTVARLTLSVAVPPTPPAVLSVSIKPKDGTLGTDDAICEGLYLVYKKKILTS